MILKILTWPDERLKKECKTVTEFNDELATDIKNMKETLADSEGIGLAANQVGIDKKICVIHIPYLQPETGKETTDDKKWWHDQEFVFINPKIIKSSGKSTYQEGCLSFPGIFENITRPARVSIKYQDESGEEKTIEDADGLFATCIQHECDHLYGVSFIDRMSRLKYMVVKKKLIRLSQNNWEEL